MDNMPTKDRRGRPSRGISESKISARLTDHQFCSLLDYGREHNTVDKKGTVNPSEVIRTMIDAYTAPFPSPQSWTNNTEVQQMKDDLGMTILFLRALEDDAKDQYSKEWISDLADRTYKSYAFLSTLLR